ncbi:MAG: HD domain-containing phosphohydrolase [Desulfuromonadales bacterium]
MFSSLTARLSIFICASVAVIHLLASQLPFYEDIRIFTELLVVLIAVEIFIGRFVSVPLDTLTRAMRLLEQGNSEASIKINGSSDMRRLGESFNLMVDRVIILLDTTAQQVFELAQAQERTQHDNELRAKNRELETSLAEVQMLNSRQESLFMGTINALVKAIEASDNYTHGHSGRVTSYSISLATRIGLPTERIKVLEQAAILHDIGKIGIDKSILHKQGKLTDEEFDIMRKHPAIAVDILRNIIHLSEVQECVAKHHERYDGKGYPYGVSGDDLPVEARIMSIADTFDAMTSHRPYRRGLPVNVAISELDKHAGSQFDPELVKQFISLVKNGELTDIYDDYLADQNREPVPRIEKMTIRQPISALVVEDDPLSSLMVRDYLTQLGHQVDEAVTGSGGIQMFLDKRYDLVLLDIGLPDYDGYTIARGMRQLEQNSGRTAENRAIICALTVCSREEGGEMALASGMNLFIEKPFTSFVMEDIISLAGQVAERNQ